MSEGVASSLNIVAYLALFASVGVVFLFANLLVGKFLRPSNPHEEKLEIYECGEPTIGSSFVQFDLRFYVVALLFIIFDVEVAFFFPWATVFGKSTHLMADDFVVAAGVDGAVELTPDGAALQREMGIRNPQFDRGGSVTAVSSQIKQGARTLAYVTIVDIAVFFAVLLVGFAYVWKRGDLDWVRAVSSERGQQRERAASTSGAPAGEPVLSA